MSSRPGTEREHLSAVDLAPITTMLFRRTCAQFPTGVTVITVRDETGHPHGMTVNSLASVSLEPPLVAISIDLRNAILGHFVSASHFAVNILAEHQEYLSRTFSNAATDRFNGVEWDAGSSGAPLISGVLAQLECAVIRAFEAGDHSVLIGEVKRAGYVDGRPLVFFDSGYHRLSEA